MSARSYIRRKAKPNKAMESTPVNVTFRANVRTAPFTSATIFDVRQNIKMIPSQKIRIIAMMLACVVSLHAEESKAYIPETTSSSETFRSRVLKVHHFTEADFEYLAYTIDWRGHEVIVVSYSTEHKLKEGDTIRCAMRASPVKVGEGKKAAITFSILSSNTTTSDGARLQSVADEVRRRQALRDAAENSETK